ncbi:MAG: prepilin-type N-terminal cleavage/methylation domain-containing protein [Patescibacteria group bacterium]|jgi:prepilin-type N-terminal cleavage/methylation domain-containing protein|nr:prepilin-type N-terminal cleavage/methylation domain-containing protein [Patescibacteria group bacterium]
MKRKKGFTLLETILVISLIGILLGIFLPAFTQLFFRNNLDTASEKIKTELYRAHSFARASKYDSNWGLYLENNQIILFSGPNYTNRDSSKDEIEGLPGQLTISGLTEIVFQKNSGLILNPGEIVISSRGINRSLGVNSKSLIY